MGHASYSSELRDTRAKTMGYHTKRRQEIFTQRELDNKMNPKGVTVREARDSENHPNSVPVILALDVTGSMGNVPHMLVKDGLPTIMSTIIQRGIPDPQLLFIGIGDHEVDSAPLQVAQFESGDEELDQWLTNVYLEGGGGGNSGESYMLAWLFAAYHTATDHWDKRGQKGFLFTVGDEPVLNSIPASAIEAIMGPNQLGDMDSAELLAAAKERYHVYHLHIRQTGSGSRQEVMDGWKQIMGDNLIIVESHEDLSAVVAETVIENVSYDVKQSPQSEETSEPSEDTDDDEPEILL